jgi:tetratricopeptide (TPR) repeat protein
MFDEAILWMDEKYASGIKKAMTGRLRMAQSFYSNKDYRNAYPLLAEYLSCYSLEDRSKALVLKEKIDREAYKTLSKWNLIIDNAQFDRIDAFYKEIKAAFGDNPIIAQIDVMYSQASKIIPERAFLSAELQLKMGKTMRAYETFVKITERYPDSVFSKKAIAEIEMIKKIPGFKEQYEAEEKDEHARGLLKNADRLVLASKNGEALNVYKDIIRLYPETDVYRTASAKKKELELTADNMFNKAEKLIKEKKYTEGMNVLKAISSIYKGSMFGDAALKELERLNNDKNVIEEINRIKENDQAYGLWQIAQNYEASGRKDLADDCYRQIIDRYPDSSYAEKSKERLEK